MAKPKKVIVNHGGKRYVFMLDAEGKRAWEAMTPDMREAFFKIADEEKNQIATMDMTATCAELRSLVAVLQNRDRTLTPDANEYLDRLGVALMSRVAAIMEPLAESMMGGSVIDHNTSGTKH